MWSGWPTRRHFSKSRSNICTWNKKCPLGTTVASFTLLGANPQSPSELFLLTVNKSSSNVQKQLHWNKMVISRKPPCGEIDVLVIKRPTWLNRCSRKLCSFFCFSWDSDTLEGTSSPEEVQLATCQSLTTTKRWQFIQASFLVVLYFYGLKT